MRVNQTRADFSRIFDGFVVVVHVVKIGQQFNVGMLDCVYNRRARRHAVNQIIFAAVERLDGDENVMLCRARAEFAAKRLKLV